MSFGNVGMRYVLNILLFLVSGAVWGRQPLLSHYTVKDGLPSNVVYDLFQDSKGYMWFMTDQGISRFDGTEFKNYSSNDGLPDNDIFRIREDRQHRYWLVCYNYKACYLFEGKIYNAGNDLLCRQIEQAGINYIDIILNENGDCCFRGRRLALLKGNKISFSEIQVPEQLFSTAYYCSGRDRAFISRDSQFRMISAMRNVIPRGPDYWYLLSNGKQAFTCREVQEKCELLQWFFEEDSLRLQRSTPIPGRVHQLTALSDGNILCCSESGLYVYDIATNRMNRDHTLPEDIIPNRTMTDKDGNRWFTTISNGVYLMPEAGPYIINEQSGLERNNILSLNLTADGSILAGDDIGGLALITDAWIRYYGIKKDGFRNRILFAGMPDHRHILTGSDNGVYRFNIASGARSLVFGIGCKAGIIRKGYCLYGAIYGAVRYSNITGRRDMLWDKRTVAIEEDHNGTVWLGSLDGLYYSRQGSIYKYSFDSVLAHSRIASLAITRSGAVVAGTDIKGLYLIRNIATAPVRIGQAEGLSSNSCKKVLADDQDNIWVCSGVGLDRISFDSGGHYTVYSYLLPDVLSRNKINNIAVKGEMLYLATAEGIVILNKQDKPGRIPLLYINTVNGVSLTEEELGKPLAFNYDRSDLQVAYSGISFTGGSKLQYKYYLKGGNGDTVVTTARMINFGALKPGKYQLLLWAKNKNGPWTGNPAVLSFLVRPPFWLTPLFLFAVVALLLLLIILFYRHRVSIIRSEADKAASVSLQMAALEMKALKAQINPHFIFNALSSIQAYYSQNNELKANYYMTSFARFIRQTLVYSESQWLPLSEEVTMLRTYIELEQMRFRQLFAFSITIAAEIDPEQTEIPVMLIQPYVENAINHGLRHLKDRPGVLDVRFELKDDGALQCVIEDNGIGIEAAQCNRVVNHQSFGMNINRQRIDAINQLYHTRIRLTIQDRSNIDAASQGTRIEILIPQKKQLANDDSNNSRR